MRGLGAFCLSALLLISGAAAQGGEICHSIIQSAVQQCGLPASALNQTTGVQSEINPNYQRYVDLATVQSFAGWEGVAGYYNDTEQEEGVGIEWNNIVSVNFASTIDPPLRKLMAHMNAGLVSMKRYEAGQASSLGELKSDSLRIDLSMGKNNRVFGKTTWNPDIITGTPSSFKYNFGQLDTLTKLLYKTGSRAYYALCYTPLPMQQNIKDPESWQAPARDPSKWEGVAQTFAGRYKDNVGYWEVSNEQDFVMFSSGGIKDYLKMFTYMARGFKKGWADIPVGGPALAFHDWWWGPFVKHVKTNKLPLDFISAHAVGMKDDSAPEVLLRRVKTIVSELGNDFPTTGIHINEFHSYPVSRYLRTSGPDLASRIIDNVNKFVGVHDLTLVSYAQLNDPFSWPDMGLIDAKNHKRPSWYALQFFAEMPVKRVQASAGGSIKVMASSDVNTAAALLWSQGNGGKVTVDMKNIPFSKGAIVIKSIGPSNLEGRVIYADKFRGNDQKISVTVPNQGVVIVKAKREADAVKPPPAPPGAYVRDYQWHSKRGSSIYNYWNRWDNTAYLGMGSESRGSAACGALFAGVRSTDRFRFRFAIDGKPASGASIGVRVDYQTAIGRYSKAVFFFESHGVSSTVPWGTKRSADGKGSVSLKEFNLRPSFYAPKGWNGRLIVSVVLKDAGKGVRVRAAIARG